MIDYENCPIYEREAREIATKLPETKCQVLNLACSSASARVYATIFRGLQNNTSISEIDVSECELGKAGLDTLIRVLPTLPQLQILKMAYTEILNDRIPNLATALSKCKQLAACNFDGSFRSYPLRATATLLNTWFPIHTIKTLILANCELSGQDCDILARMIQQSSSLTSLDISSNQLCDENLCICVRALAVNKCITSIDLGYNYLDTECATALRNVLEKGSVLKNIAVDWCDMSGSVAVEILKGLTVNTSVEKINMGNNLMSDENLPHLVEVVAKNKTLRNLNIEGQFSDEGISIVLLPALQTNKTLYHIYVSGSKYIVEQINAIADRNRLYDMLLPLSTVLSRDYSSTGLVEPRLSNYIAQFLHVQDAEQTQ